MFCEEGNNIGALLIEALLIDEGDMLLVSGSFGRAAIGLAEVFGNRESASWADVSSLNHPAPNGEGVSSFTASRSSGSS